MRTGDVTACVGRRWRAERTIGAGHTAAVWLLVPEDGSSSERLVAKCIRPPRPGSVGRGMSSTDFVAETRTLHRLLAAEGPVPRERSRFPWVYACDPEKRHFVMEFVPGVALRDIVGVRLLTIEQILAMTIQLAEGLAATVRAGLRNTDLKLDAVLWDAEAERLVILDWNVCRERRPADDAGWLGPELAFAAAVLDGVLLHASQGVSDQLPDWSRPFDRAPARWGSYLRVFQRVLTELAEQPTARTLDALRTRLVAIADALARQPEALLSAVKQQVGRARAAPHAHRADLTEAAAFAELAVAARRHAVAMRARLLMSEALELLGPTAASLETLRATAMGAGDDALVAPGEGVVLHRLRRFARVRTAALGIGRPLTEALEAYEDQQWRVAADRLSALRERFARSTELSADLQALLDESRGLAACLEGLRALDEADRSGLAAPTADTSLHALTELARRRTLILRGAADLERGLALIRAVPWSSALMVMLAQLPHVLGLAREALGPTPAGPERARPAGSSRQVAVPAIESGERAAAGRAEIAAASGAAASGAAAASRAASASGAAASGAAAASRAASASGAAVARRPRPDRSEDSSAPPDSRDLRAARATPPVGGADQARRDVRRPRPLPGAAASVPTADDRLTLVDVRAFHPPSPSAGAVVTDDLAADFELDLQTEISPSPGMAEANAAPTPMPASDTRVSPIPDALSEEDPVAARPKDRALLWVLLAAVIIGVGGIWWMTGPDGASAPPPRAPIATVAPSPADRGVVRDARVALDLAHAVVDAGPTDVAADAASPAAVGPDAQAPQHARAKPPNRKPASKRRVKRPARPASPPPTPAIGVQDEDRPDAPLAAPSPPPPGSPDGGRGVDAPSAQAEDRPGGGPPATGQRPTGASGQPGAGGDAALDRLVPPGARDGTQRRLPRRSDAPADAGATAPPQKPASGPARASDTSPDRDDEF